jgi:hypothetical protein
MRMGFCVLLCASPLASCRRCTSLGTPLLPAHLRPPRRRTLAVRTLAAGPRMDAASEDAAWSATEPESMGAIDRALQLETVAPQWRPPADADDAGPPNRLPALQEDELAALECAEERPIALSEHEHELRRRSLASLDYLGNWANLQKPPTDSIILTCRAPDVHVGEGGPEYSCACGDFTAERRQLHARIVERMLTSARTTAGSISSSPSQSALPNQRAGAAATARSAQQPSAAEPLQPPPPPPPAAAAAAAAVVGSGGPPAMVRDPPALDAQHVFVLVGVPGSGKDTVLKRYLRSLGLPLLDASADLVKEYASNAHSSAATRVAQPAAPPRPYRRQSLLPCAHRRRYLAAWGQDELSRLVRENSHARGGPGKHLLHAQYLHRESILICVLVVERCARRTPRLRGTICPACTGAPTPPRTPCVFPPRAKQLDRASPSPPAPSLPSAPSFPRATTRHSAYSVMRRWRGVLPRFV